MSRLIGVVVWCVALAAVVGIWRLGADLTGRPAPARAVPDNAPRMRTAFIPGPSGDGWKVVHQLSAHHILVLEVETSRVQEAAPIAQQLAEPVKARYSEIVVYFFRPGTRGSLPAARVQWTPKNGYLETQYEKTDR